MIAFSCKNSLAERIATRYNRKKKLEVEKFKQNIPILPNIYYTYIYIYKYIPGMHFKANRRNRNRRNVSFSPVHKLLLCLFLRIKAQNKKWNKLLFTYLIHLQLFFLMI